MAYNMTTKFTDNRTGEEFEFLGTNITFSERELIHLEEEYDEAEDKRLVERLMCTGFFEEEWTDYYAETDVDAEDDDNDQVGEAKETETEEETESESVYLEKDCSVDTEDAVQGTNPQFNVPVFHRESTVPDRVGNAMTTAFTFPVPTIAAPVTLPNVVMVPKIMAPNNIKFAATMSQLRRSHLYMLNVVN